MANLYELSRELENFDFEVDPETGELLNAPEWDAINLAYEEKADNIASWIKNLNSDIAAIESEVAALKKRIQMKKNKVSYLERLLTDNMGGNKFESARCVISFRKSQKVFIEDESRIPKAFLRKTITFAPDKNGITKAIKEGHKVRGCQLVENINIQIR